MLTGCSAGKASIADIEAYTTAPMSRQKVAEQGMCADYNLSERVRAPDQRGSACVDDAPDEITRQRRHERQRRRVPFTHSLLFSATIVLLFSSHSSSLASAATASREGGESPVSDSYSSYLWRRAEAIWEAATGELPTPAPLTGHVPALADTGSSEGNGEISDSDTSTSKSRDTTSASESPLLTSHPENTGRNDDDEGESTTTMHADDAGEQLTGVDLGRHLFHNQGDAAGAELVCLEALQACTGSGSSYDGTAMQNIKVEALTCLGETRLALHQASYAKAQSARAGSVAHGLYISQSMGKLRASRAALDEAVAIDPTHAQARLGIGTAMMLTATRRGDADVNKNASHSNRGDSAALLLFDATQHLEAAARMTTLLNASASSSSSSSSLHLVSLHNLALTHMALGDVSSAVIPMQKAAAELLRLSDTAPSSALGVMEQSNLGSAIVQAGMIDEGLQILEGIEMKYCQKSSSGNSGGSESSSTLRLCSIVYNNLGIAHEIKATTKEGDLGGDGPMEETDSVLLTTEEYYDSSVGASPNAFNAYNQDAYARTKREETIRIEQGGSSESDQNGISEHWKAAIEALEAIVHQDPKNSRSWVSLSKARIRAGDNAGALNAAARGVSTAQGKDELDLANSALEDALSGLGATESAGSGSETALAHPTTTYSEDSTSPAEVRALRLEQKVLNLKFQLLEQRMGGNFVPQHAGGMPRQHHSAWGASFAHEDEERHFSPDTVSAPSASDSQFNSMSDSHEDNASPTLPGQDEESADGSPDSVAVKETTSSVKEDIVEEQAIREDEHTAVSGEGIKDEDSKVAGSADITEEEREEEEPPQQNAIYGTGDDEGLEIGEERSTEDPDDEIVMETETIVTRKVEEEPQTEEADEKDKEEDAQDTKPKVALPDLYNPPKSQSPPELPAIVPSLMKLSDAYMQKENYPLAQKQFKKVLKKAPLHIPALLGYATAIERSGNPKKILEAALAYGNATKVALGVGDDRLATIALRRATSLCSSASSSSEDKLNTLRSLAELAFTGDLASEIYYAIGSESMGSALDGETDSESNTDEGIALNAFKIANGFACLGQEASNECHGHGTSLSRLARLTLDEDAEESLRYVSAALQSDIDDETKIEAHAVAGQAKMVCIHGAIR